MPARGVAMALAVVLAIVSSSPALGVQEQAQILPAELLKGGNIQLVNNLQAWSDAMLVFRQFRRELRRIDRFEEVDDRADADLVCVLSGDLDVLEEQGIVNRGIAYPSGFATSKIMLLVIYDADTNNVLYLDGIDWDTTANMTRTASYTKLVQRLKVALDKAQ